MAIKSKAKVSVGAPKKDQEVVVPTEETPAVVLPTSINGKDAFLSVGISSLGAMTDAGKANVGSKRGTLVCNRFIGISTIIGKRKDGDKMVDCIEPQAGEFVSSEDVVVPRLDVRYDVKSGLNPDQVTFEKVKKGEKFTLTQAEAAIFLAAPEYSYICGFKEVADGLRIGLKTKGFFEGKAKFPTPSFEFTSTALAKYGAPKGIVETIDTKGPNGEVEIPDEYARFRQLLIKRKSAGTGSIKAQNKEGVTQAVLAASIREIFGIKLGQKK